MTKVLVLNASTTGSTKGLWDLTAKEFHPDWEITTVDLNTEIKAGLNATNMAEFYAEGTKWIDMMQQYDKVVFLAGMINYGMPVALKNLIDKICLPKVTFAYNENGKYSPMQGQWRPEFTLFFTSGSSKNMYPQSVLSLPEIFMEQLKWNGIEKVQYIWLDGTNMPDVAALSVEDKFNAMKPKLKNIVKG